MRKKKRAAGVVLFLLMTAVIAFLLFKTVFVVRSVNVTGDYELDRDTIIRASGIEFGGALIDVDAYSVEKSINALGRVKFESMKRSFPGAIELQVSARKGVAMALHMGKILVLDGQGFVVEERDEVPDSDLVYISDMGIVSHETGRVVEGDIKRIEAYRQIMDALARHNAAGTVSEISLSSLEDIRMITRSGTTVYIGNCDKIGDKIAWMKAVSTDLDLRGESGGRLDVSSAFQADYLPPGLLEE